MRDHHEERCTATTRAGAQCRKLAIPGGKVCRYHGGRAPQVRRKAAERVIEDQARAVAAAYAVNTGTDVADPIAALLALAAEVLGFKNYVASRVEQLRAEEWRYGGLSGEQLRAEVAVYERAMDRAGRLLVEVNRLGLEERQVRIAERQGALLVEVITKVLDEMDLTPEQRRLGLEALAQELRAIDPGTPDGR